MKSIALQNVMLKETLTSKCNKKKTQVKNKKIPLRLRNEKAQIWKISMSISGPKQFEHKLPYFNEKLKGYF